MTGVARVSCEKRRFIAGEVGVLFIVSRGDGVGA